MILKYKQQKPNMSNKYRRVCTENQHIHRRWNPFVNELISTQEFHKEQIDKLKIFEGYRTQYMTE